MSSIPEFNPYDVLGVAKDATLAEIKSAHRKLVLKCHPDKIKDESMRSHAQDQFQKVQQSYELLSDETSRIKYDQKVRLAELKREMNARGSSSSRYSAREFRDGRYYEERAPADDSGSPEPPYFEEDGRYFEPQRPTARKNDEFGGTRTRSRATEEKKKSKVPPTTSHTTTKDSRSTAKASRAGRDKYRTKERRREVSDKHIYESDRYLSDSDSPSEYEIPVKMPGRYRETKSRSNESARRYEAPRYEEEPLSEAECKHDVLHNSARDYIRRSRETLEPERRHRPSRSPRPYESPELDSPSSRHPSRTKRSSREQVRPSSSHHSSLEDLDASRPRVPPLPTANTFPGVKVSTLPRSSTHQPSRSATSVRSQPRAKVARSEAVNFMGGLFGSDASRAPKMRSDKYDSEYASTSPVPEVPLSEPSPKSSRYKPSATTILREPPSTAPPHPTLRHARTYSPTRQERRPPPRSSTTTTYAYPAEGKHGRLYGEVDMGRVDKKSGKFTKDLRPDVTYVHAYPPPDYYGEHRQPSAPRRQSAY